MDNKAEHERPELECEKFWVFVTMIAVGGYLGAYTYILKGGVFCTDGEFCPDVRQYRDV